MNFYRNPWPWLHLLPVFQVYRSIFLVLVREKNRNSNKKQPNFLKCVFLSPPHILGPVPVLLLRSGPVEDPAVSQCVALNKFSPPPLLLGSIKYNFLKKTSPL